jgi:hypothetical protein
MPSNILKKEILYIKQLKNLWYRKTIKYWRDHEKEYKKVINQNDSGIPLSLNDILDYSLSIEDSPLKERNKVANIKLISRLIKKKGYTKRIVGHRGQEISKTAMKDCDKFLFDIIQLRKKYNFDLKNILNCDETAVCLNNPANKTIIKKGTKSVNVKTLKREKMRITVLLTITGEGKFLPPFIIFKGEPDSKLYKQIQKYEEVKTKKIIATTQKNAWIDERTFKKYFKLVLEPYNPLDKKLLFMDKCTTHIKKKYKIFTKY